jgi:tetratricopeptide (TPR) repeat protein
MATDQWGCPITGDASEVALVEAAMTDYVTMSPAIVTRLEPLAGGGPLARALLAQLLTQTHRAPLVNRARELSDAAYEDRAGLSGRERAHIDAARAWSRGDLTATIAAFGHALADHPTDLHALRSSYLLRFNNGDLIGMLASVERSRPAWHDDLPLASYLDGMESFALEEMGHYHRAEALGRQGVARDPDDLWAIHAVAHVLEMEQRREEGVAWIGADNPGLEGRPGFVGHLWWHHALALVVLGPHTNAIDSFDRQVYPGASEEGLDLSNAISLLARLEVAGADVGQRWERLAGPASARIGQHSHPFNDSHFVLALSRAGRQQQCATLIGSMTDWAAHHHDHGAEVLGEVGLAVARGVAAFGAGRWGEAAEALAPTAAQWWRLGGSHAQRQLYQIILDAAVARTTGDPS